jgi:dihydroflavonol-4-reductase
LKVLVTGASGFIGGHITRKLLDKGYDVNVLIRRSSSTANILGYPYKVHYGDLRDQQAVRSALAGCRGLFHAAALYGFWAKDPGDFYSVNVEGTKDIMKIALEEGVKKIVYTSSESTLVCRNGSKKDFELASTSDVYGDYKKSKLLAEIEVRKMALEGCPVVIVNPTTPIGSADIVPTPTGRIVLDMLNGAMPAYVNTGLNVIDVEDVAAGHILAYEKAEPGERFVLGNRDLSLRQIMDIIGGIAGIKVPRTQIPLGFAITLAYADEFISGKLLKRHPRIPLAAVRTAYKKKFFDCSIDTGKLGLKLTPVEEAFEKSINWFIENGYVKNRR